MTGACNVLVSAAGRRVELVRLLQGAAREQGAGGAVVAADVSPLAPALYCADAFELVPRLGDPSFVERMIEVCLDHGVRLLVPTIDTELGVYASERDRFAAAGVRVAVSGPATIDVTGDKRRFHGFLVAEELPTVVQVDADTPERVLDEVGLPCVIKPVAGSSSVGLAVASTEAEVRAACRSGAIAQSVASGDEYTVDVFTDASGAVVEVVPRRRLAVRAGEVAKAVTEEVPEVAGLARSVVEALPDPTAALCVQIFRDPADASLRVIEVNARFGGGFPLAAAAGADFTRYLVAETVGAELPGLSWRRGMTMLRFDESVFLDGLPEGP
jgi:carbamoyl-phosphate synthase large subunit